MSGFGGFGVRNQQREEDAAAMNAHRAALEALFTPKPQQVAPQPSKRDSARMVTARAADENAEQLRLVGRLVSAEGRAAITRAADDVARAGFAFPDEQEVRLQLLEHANEERVRDAIAGISRLLDGEPPKRRALLDARLRRVEEQTEEATTRALAAELRKKLARAARPL